MHKFSSLSLSQSWLAMASWYALLQRTKKSLKVKVGAFSRERTPWYLIALQMVLEGFPHRNVSHNYNMHHDSRLSEPSMQNLYKNVHLPSTTTKLPFQVDYANPQAGLTECVSNGDQKAWFQSVRFKHRDVAFCLGVFIWLQGGCGICDQKCWSSSWPYLLVLHK